MFYVDNEDRKFNHEKIQNATRKEYEKLYPLLLMMEKDDLITDIRQFAYMLATIKHETGNTYKPILEYLTDESAEKQYFDQHEKRKALGNLEKGDGAAFKGCGYVQVTGRANALKLEPILMCNLSNPPSNFRTYLMTPEKSYKACSYGMRLGLFTARKLDDYIFGDKCDFINARKIINGRDCNIKIANYAMIFLNHLEFMKD